jgi:hypothetical protein
VGFPGRHGPSLDQPGVLTFNFLFSTLDTQSMPMCELLSHRLELSLFMEYHADMHALIVTFDRPVWVLAAFSSLLNTIMHIV